MVLLPVHSIQGLVRPDEPLNGVLLMVWRWWCAPLLRSAQARPKETELLQIFSVRTRVPERGACKILLPPAYRPTW